MWLALQQQNRTCVTCRVDGEVCVVLMKLPVPTHLPTHLPTHRYISVEGKHAVRDKYKISNDSQIPSSSKK